MRWGSAGRPGCAGDVVLQCSRCSVEISDARLPPSFFCWEWDQPHCVVHIKYGLLHPSRGGIHSSLNEWDGPRLQRPGKLMSIAGRFIAVFVAVSSGHVNSNGNNARAVILLWPLVTRQGRCTCTCTRTGRTACVAPPHSAPPLDLPPPN